MNNRYLSLTGLEAGSLRSGCQHGCVPGLGVGGCFGLAGCRLLISSPMRVGELSEVFFFFIRTVVSL